MARLLDRLLRDSEIGTPAIPASPAIPKGNQPQESQSSRNSTGSSDEKAGAMRSHLATLAAGEGLPTSLVDGLDDADLAACAGLTNATLRAYLRALDRGHRMDAGQVPPEWGTPVVRTCEGCGPVLLWADCPPVVKSCPWCFRRQAGKAIPRPTPREVGGDE